MLVEYIKVKDGSLSFKRTIVGHLKYCGKSRRAMYFIFDIQI